MRIAERSSDEVVEKGAAMKRVRPARQAGRWVRVWGVEQAELREELKNKAK